MTNECPQCKSPVTSEEQRFCYRCGYVLQASSAPVSTGEAPPQADSVEQRIKVSSTDPAKDRLAERTLKIEAADLVEGAPDATQWEGASLRVLLPTGDVFDRQLVAGETSVGKGPHNAIVIADPAVSTSHASIMMDADGYAIKDLGSRNGTFVDGERLTAQRRLHHGDVIGMGRSRLTFRIAGHSDTVIIKPPEMTESNLTLPLPLTESSLAEAVVFEGLIKKEDVERLRSRGGRRLYRAITDEGLASQEALRDLMARVFMIPVVDLRALDVSETAVSRFPARLAIQRNLLPISEDGDRLVVAAADPTDADAIEEVKRETRLPVEIRLATARDISEQVRRFYGPKLVAVLPSGERVEHVIKQGETGIGKAAHNQIVLADPAVSNSHAVILAREGGYILVDLDSRNGTFVGAERLGAQGRALRHGDAIQVGHTRLTFRNPSETTDNITAVLSKDVLDEIRSRSSAEAKPAAQPQAGSLAGALMAEVETAPASEPAHGSEGTQTVEDGPGGASPESGAEAGTGTPKKQAVKEAKEGKKGDKKKKKKEKDERLRAAYIGAFGRVLAAALSVILAVGITLYLKDSGFGPGKPVIETGKKGKAKLKFGKASAGTPFEGGTFEASGVVQVPGTSGVLFVDDTNAREVLWMQLDESGRQVGPVKPVPLGAEVEDMEGITYGNSYFYAVGSQSNPKGGARNALIRFVLDGTGQAVQGKPEAIGYFRSFLLASVAELKGLDDKKASEGGLDVEGVAWDPDHERLLLGLRSPLVDGKALIVPLKMNDPRGPFSADNLRVDDPGAIHVGLEGLGIRDIQYDSRLKSFLIIAGEPEHHEKKVFKLWQWNGNPDQSQEEDQPQEASSLDPKMKPEGVTRVKIGTRDYIFLVGDGSSYAKIDYSQGG